DSFGNATSVTDPLNHTATFAYDLDRRPTGATDPTGARVSRLYDAQGHVTSGTDAAGIETDYVFDSQAFLTKQTTAVGTALSAVTTLLRDGAGNLTGVQDPRGNLTQILYDVVNRATVTI